MAKINKIQQFKFPTESHAERAWKSMGAQFFRPCPPTADENFFHTFSNISLFISKKEHIFALHFGL